MAWIAFCIIWAVFVWMAWEKEDTPEERNKKYNERRHPY